MIYVYLALGITVLALIAKIVRWWNLPKVAEARKEKVEARQQGRTDRARIRAERRESRRPRRNTKE